ncbi:hypothetical protein RI543_002648 [Arxiozyma heterogenica]|uniref:26S proteasome complex subunit SEM1 n=1 Tax=Arxiozyma heterogenica TaxID=278026 RepID=A0AAN7ZXX9_9SACH|nr:hypothetical protein RI543_002648 [Kazachstania heterogenica]
MNLEPISIGLHKILANLEFTYCFIKSHVKPTAAKALLAQSESSKMNTEEESFIKKTLDEDDQFEDFPVDTWPDSETVKAAGLTENLWEENWDDVDVDDNFTANLKEELEKHKQQQQQQQQQQ